MKSIAPEGARARTHELIADGVVCALFALFLAIVPRFVNLWDIDFRKAYYPVGKAVLNTGTFVYTYEGFKNVPVVSLLLAPFALVGEQAARRWFLYFELVSYFAAFAVFIRSFARNHEQRAVAFLLFALCRPFYICLAFGQLTPFALLVLLSMIGAYQRGLRRRTGALLSLAFLLKIPAGLLFFYFLRKRAWRIIIVSMITFTIFIAVSVGLFGLPLHFDYYHEVIRANSGSTLLAYNNQNIYAFIVRYLHPPAFDNWNMVRVPKGLFYAITLCWVACLIVHLARFSGRRKADRQTQVELASLTCILLSVFPISWDHYYLFMVFPLFIAYRLIRQQKKWLQVSLWLLAAILLNIPESIIRAPRIDTSWIRLTVISAPFMSCLLLLGLLTWQGRSVHSRTIASFLWKFVKNTNKTENANDLSS